MNGSRPKSQKPNPSGNLSGGKPPTPRKPRRVKSSTPWAAMSILFAVYALIGMLMSIPMPPYWVWIVGALAIPMLALGFNRPVVTAGKSDFGGLMAYLGGLMMAIALAVSINYIGSENSYDDVPFFTAIAVLGALTLLAVFLTAIAAILNAQAGTRLMTKAGYGRSVGMVMTTSFMGLSVGGVIGLAVLTMTTAAA
ncbi:MAG: hypothetical protein ACFB0D_07835 [Phormidesmis sp.]